MHKLKVSIVGASGYGGGELLRILLGHPNVEIQQVTSRKFARFPIDIVHPNLRGASKLKFSKPDDLEECDILFLCMPNGESQKKIDFYMSKAKKIIDLGADFRLTNIESYNHWYGEHVKPEYLGKFIYGIAELHRDEIKNAQYVACGGCEATCSILTLYPLVVAGVIETERIIIDAKIGSSAAGMKVSSSSHHPIRANCLRSYNPTDHRHSAEIEQELFPTFTRGGQRGGSIHISATAVNLVRGILVTASTWLKEGYRDLGTKDLMKIYKDTYIDEPFIRIIDDKLGNYRMPEPKLLWGTNYCDISVVKEKCSNRVVAIGAIDNLCKGTAGQAVQAMNIMNGWDEKTGLEFTGLHPV